METNSLYEVVNKTTTIEYDGEVKVTKRKGYDSKGRVVRLATDRDYPNGSRGYVILFVDENGYWRGGGYDPIIDQFVEFAQRKYVEGEIE